MFEKVVELDDLFWYFWRFVLEEGSIVFLMISFEEYLFLIFLSWKKNRFLEFL